MSMTPNRRRDTPPLWLVAIGLAALGAASVATVTAIVWAARVAPADPDITYDAVRIGLAGVVFAAAVLLTSALMQAARVRRRRRVDVAEAHRLAESLGPVPYTLTDAGWRTITEPGRYEL